MPEGLLSQTGNDRLNSWCEKILTTVKALVESKELPNVLMDRYFQFYEHEMDPVLRLMMGDPEHEARADVLKDLRDSLEAFLQTHPSNAQVRKIALAKVYKASIALQVELQPSEAEEAVPETRMRDLAWRTYMGDDGHVIFDAGGGLVMPISGDIKQFARPGIIAQAIRQQPAYPSEIRPNNIRKNPGALLTIKDAQRLLVVGDLHGRYENLELVLADKDNWQALKEGTTHLVFLGDAIHPRSSTSNQDSANADSLRVMLLIMSLRAEHPGSVHYLLGNHENAHIGGLGVGKGKTDVRMGFRTFVERHISVIVLDAYRDFLRSAPAAAKFAMQNGQLLLVHASPSPLVHSDEGLINLTLNGHQGKALTDIVWRRNFDPEVLRGCLRDVGADFAICAHTHPTAKGEAKYGYKCFLDHAFGGVAGLLLIVNSQNNTFGYVDIDLTQPVPKRVEELKAPDGNSAFRAMRRAGIARTPGKALAVRSG